MRVRECWRTSLTAVGCTKPSTDAIGSRLGRWTERPDNRNGNIPTQTTDEDRDNASKADDDIVGISSRRRCQTGVRDLSRPWRRARTRSGGLAAGGTRDRRAPGSLASDGIRAGVDA
jgi:hypothetical protein